MTVPKKYRYPSTPFQLEQQVMVRARTTSVGYVKLKDLIAFQTFQLANRDIEEIQ